MKKKVKKVKSDKEQNKFIKLLRARSFQMVVFLAILIFYTIYQRAILKEWDFVLLIVIGFVMVMLVMQGRQNG